MARDRQLALNTEYPEPDEEELAAKISAVLREIAEQRFLQGLTYRSVNTKTYAAVRAEVIVEPNLPSEFRIGVFREPRTFPAWIRFAGSHSKSLPDTVREVRSVGLKLMDVEGPKLLPSEPDCTTHDFTFISHPRFPTRNPRDFLQLVSSGLLHDRVTLASLWRVPAFLLGNPAILGNLLSAQVR